MFNYTSLRSGILVPIVLSVNVLFAQNDTAKVKQLEEVIVTGQFAPQSVRNSVYKVRVITQDQIRLRGATELAGILNTEAGIRFSTDYTLGETDINILGMSGQNVKVLLDGIPLVDRGSTKQSLSQVDINSVERIEIVEGPMSVVYGTDALAGVINIITKKPKNNNNLSVIARIQEETVEDFYSPFANEGIHNEHISVSGQQHAWQYFGYGTRNTFGGWTGQAAFRAQESKPKDQWMTGGSLGFHSGNINARYRLDYLNEDIYAAGALNPNNYRAKDQDYITNRFTHQLQAEWQISGRLKMSSAASYQDYTRKTETYILDYNNGTKTASAGDGEWDIAKFKTFFFRNTAQWYINSFLSVQPGIEIKSDKTSGQRISGEPDIADYSLFVSAEIKPTSAINLRPGIRFSKNSIYDAPPIIPSINTKFSISKNADIRVSYARGFRAPILRELYFHFFDASHSIQGNPDLKAEYSNSYIGSLTYRFAATSSFTLSSSLSGFYNDFNNRIDLALGAGNVYTYINISKYKTTGGTINNTARYKNLSVSLDLSYVGRYNIYYDDATYKTMDQTRFTWSPEVNSNIAYSLPKLQAQVAVFYKFTGSLPSFQTTIDPATNQSVVYLAKTSSYHWADVTITKNIFKRLTLQAGVKNLFDVTRIQNTSQDVGGAHSTGGPVLVGYGRSYFTGLTFQWSKN